MIDAWSFSTDKYQFRNLSLIGLVSVSYTGSSYWDWDDCVISLKQTKGPAIARENYEAGLDFLLLLFTLGISGWYTA